VTSDRDILEYVHYAEEDARLESRVQVQRGVDAPLVLQAYVRRGARRGVLDPLACDADTLLALIDRGDLAFRGGWLTLTPAGKATLARVDAPAVAPEGEG
jgi:hypothetical protein